MTSISQHGTDDGRTSREQHIEQVSAIIAEWDRNAAYDPEWDDQAEALRANAEGWTFDVRYDYQTYIGDDNFTRVEGLQLSGADLAAAISMGIKLRSGLISE